MVSFGSYYFMDQSQKNTEVGFAKPTPKIVQQIDLEPGEYKIKVQDSKTIEM